MGENLGVYGGHVKSTRGIQSLLSQNNFVEDRLAYNGWGLGMAHGGQHARDHRSFGQSRNTYSIISLQVACRPVHELFTGAERMPVSSRFIMWGGQDVGRGID